MCRLKAFHVPLQLIFVADFLISPAVSSALPDARASGLQQWSRLGDVFAKIKEQQSQVGFGHLPRVSVAQLNMSDGAQLTTTLIIPYPYDAKRGAVLCRSPYGPTSENIADIFVAEGMVGVLQDDRGTFTSTGKYDVFRSASKDGLEAMEWITKQSWSNGEVFTVGVSADGINEAAEVIAAPPMMKGQWWMWTTGNGHHFTYPGGAFRQDLTDGYMNAMNVVIHGVGKKVIEEVKQNEVYSHYWDPITVCGPSGYKCLWNNVKWPIILNTGWWDIFQQSSMETWAGIREKSDASVRDKHIHVVSPLGHCILSAVHDLHPELAAQETRATAVSAMLASEFFTGNFNGPTRSKLGRINIYMMGGFERPSTGPWDYWTSVDDWPAFKPWTLFLGAKNSLSTEASQQLSSEAYDYDPTHPAPMIGGNNLPIPIFTHITHCGYADLSSREKRNDVITFDSQELSANTPVVGMITAKLFVSSSAKDTDFFVTVSDLSKSLLGTEESTLVRYGMLRMRWREGVVVQSASLVPSEVYEITVSLASTAYVFPKGHRIRVSVSSAADPYYDVNPNTGKLIKDKSTAVVAHNIIYMGAQYPSQLVLPVVQFKDIPKNEGFPVGPETATSAVIV